MREIWCLLYLHDWNAPEIHGFYETWQEAEKMKAAKTFPEKYYVRRAKNLTGKGY
jgi:hypothetical protein